jgi:hypothetical protein
MRNWCCYWAYLPANSPGEYAALSKVAEGEELGSNLLHVARSSRGSSGGSERPFDPAAGADRAQSGPWGANRDDGGAPSHSGSPRSRTDAWRARVLQTQNRPPGQDGAAIVSHRAFPWRLPNQRPFA